MKKVFFSIAAVGVAIASLALANPPPRINVHRQISLCLADAFRAPLADAAVLATPDEGEFRRRVAASPACGALSSEVVVAAAREARLVAGGSSSSAVGVVLPALAALPPLPAVIAATDAGTVPRPVSSTTEVIDDAGTSVTVNYYPPGTPPPALPR